MVRVCGWRARDRGVLCSGGARVPRLVAGPRPVLSGCSGASETPPDTEKPVHTIEPMVSPARGGHRGRGFLRFSGRARRTSTARTAWCSVVELIWTNRSRSFFSVFSFPKGGGHGEVQRKQTKMVASTTNQSDMRGLPTAEPHDIVSSGEIAV